MNARRRLALSQLVSVALLGLFAMGGGLAQESAPALAFENPTIAESQLAEDLDLYVLAKGCSYQQSNAAVSVILSTDGQPFRFSAILDPANPAAFNSVSLLRPNRLLHPLQASQDRFVLELFFNTKSNFDLAFPIGTYKFIVETLTNGVYTNAFNVVSNTTPSVPRISNWQEAQDIDAAADFTLTWDAFANGTSNDLVHLQVWGKDLSTVLATPALQEPDALDGTARALTIPANLLIPGESYAGKLLFFKRASLKSNANLGALNLTGYFKETFFSLNASAASPGGRFQFSQPEYTVSEPGSVASITVIRERGLVGVASVDFATVARTAVTGLDYLPATGTLSFADGETSKTFQVTILDDAVLETSENVGLALSNPQGALLGPRNLAVLHILDNEIASAGKLQFSAASYSVSETSRLATITVTRTGSTNRAVSVRYDTSAGTAVPDLEYTNVSGILSFALGQVSRTFRVPICNDTLCETDKTVFLSLSCPTGGASLGRTNAVLSLVNEDRGGSISFCTNLFTVAETGLVANITIVRTGGAASDVTVEYWTCDATATADADYLPVSGLLTFAANEKSKQFAIPILDDTLSEGHETVNLTLANPTGGATLGAISNAVLKILDNELAIQFSRPNYTNSEACTNATITVIRTGPVNQTNAVDYATSPGTAVPGADYLDRSGRLVFTPGVASRTFSVPILNNTFVQENRTINLTLSNPADGTLLGPITQAVLTIAEDDKGGVISFTSTNYTVSETCRVAVVTVARTSGLASGVTVDYATCAGTAIADLEYTNVSGSLSFGAGQLTRTFTIPLVNDNYVEPGKTVLLSLGNVTGGACLGRSNAVLVISSEDRGGVISFRTNLFAISETGAVATIVVDRIGGSAGGVTVDFTTADFTAWAPDDYTACSGTLFFGPAERTKTFTIPIINDDIAQGNQSLFVFLTNVTGGATLGSVKKAAVKIVDDEILLQFSNARYVVYEGIGNATLTVLRSGPTNRSVQVSYATSNDTAIANQDYAPRSGKLTFGPGVTSQEITIPIINDATYQSNHAVLVSLFNPSAGALLGAISNASLVITDDERRFYVDEASPVIGRTLVLSGSFAGQTGIFRMSCDYLYLWDDFIYKSGIFRISANGTYMRSGRYIPFAGGPVTGQYTGTPPSSSAALELYVWQGSFFWGYYASWTRLTLDFTSYNYGYYSNGSSAGTFWIE